MQSKSLNGVYLMSSIYGLAGSFTGIFIPIYFLSLNINLSQIIWFYIIYTIGIFIFFFFANKITQILGLRKTILLGYPFLFLYFFLVYAINRYGIPMYVIALVNAIQTALYWFPLHIWITNISKKEKLGNELGKFFAFSKAIKIIAPFAAGFIAVYFGFESLFIFAGGIYLISAIPILFFPEFPCNDKLRMKDVASLIKKYRKYFLADVFENLREDAEGIIWPIFVFLSFKSILSIGYIGTLGAVGGALFALLVGRYADKVDKRKLMLAGSIIMVVIWMSRFFVTSQFAFYLLTLCAGFFEALILIPLNKTVYRLAKKEGAATFILFREIPISIGRIILYALALFMVSDIKYVFILPTIAGVYFIYLSGKDLEAEHGELIVKTNG